MAPTNTPVLLSPNGMNLVDLHVYVDGAASLGSGHLYDFTYTENTPDFPLPFTYPTFAAALFYPLHFLPFAFVAVAWLLLMVAALYVVVRISLELLLGAVARESRWQTAAVAWTALGMWLEPMRSNFDYGQVNMFLVLAGMVAVRSSRWWLSGLLVGAAAGVKLTRRSPGCIFWRGGAGRARCGRAWCSRRRSGWAGWSLRRRRAPISDRWWATRTELDRSARCGISRCAVR
jgi:alpha-1,2-mannosyltransferase